MTFVRHRQNRRVTRQILTGTSLAFAVTLTLALAGCTPWPDYANGGMAERHAVGWRPVRSAQQRHDALVNAGAERFFPARMVDVRNLINRAMREHEGGLLRDADLTIFRAEELIFLVEADMQKQTAGRSSPRK